MIERRNHLSLIAPSPATPEFLTRLASRQSQLRDSAANWEARTYPVLAVLAPALTNRDNKFEYPGDPMCLYAALSLPIQQVQDTRAAGFGSDAAYNDVCPAWGDLPTREYRFASELERRFTSPRNTDQTLFDPRVWTGAAREQLRARLVAEQPRVVLVSMVSPAHRYALEIGRFVRRYAPSALIVFGGRHQDESLTWDMAEGRLCAAYSSSLAAYERGETERVFDFLVSGEAYDAVAHLMQAISVAMALDTRTATTDDVVGVLDRLSGVRGAVRGHGVIVVTGPERADVFPFSGPALDSTSLPAPYAAFDVRARFPIFVDALGQARRTAHMMSVGDGVCPLRCSFCSESSAARHVRQVAAGDPVAVVLHRLIEYVGYGAEAVYFDDPIFWRGSTPRMLAFCRALTQLKEAVRGGQVELQGDGDDRRLSELVWAAQLTFDFVADPTPADHAEELLRALSEAGATYVYFGIESMAEEVMSGVHKHSRRPGPRWRDRVRQGLARVREHGIRCGASVLFGLDGETQASIDETIAEVADLMNEGLLQAVSPNVVTYHPGTAFTRNHGMQDHLDYATLTADTEIRPPYCYFEEAYPGVISKLLREDDLWHIHEGTQALWSVETQRIFVSAAS